jgi:hypothetical protein
MPRDQPGPRHEGGKLPAEGGSVLGVQVYLVIPAVHAERKGLVGRAAGQIVLELDFDLLHCFPPDIMRQPESFPASSGLIRGKAGFSIIALTGLIPGLTVNRCACASDSKQTAVIPSLTRSDPAHRQARCRAAQRLDLPLLVLAQHERLRRRADIQPDDVADPVTVLSFH